MNALTDTTREQLHRNVLAIVRDIETPRDVLADDPGVILPENLAPCGDCYTYDEENETWHDMDGDEVEAMPQSGMDYIAEQLAIEYTVDARGEFLGATILVTTGGPGISIDTRRDTVTGSWGTDTVSMHYADNLGLHEAAEELFSAMRT